MTLATCIVNVTFAPSDIKIPATARPVYGTAAYFEVDAGDTDTTVTRLCFTFDRQNCWTETSSTEDCGTIDVVIKFGHRSVIEPLIHAEVSHFDTEPEFVYSQSPAPISCTAEGFVTYHGVIF